MFQSFKDWLYGKWQGRFLHGATFSLGTFLFGRFTVGGGILKIVLLEIGSVGSGHWPWTAFELALQFGPMPSWHINLLGFLVGQCRVSDLNEDGSIKGKDYQRTYFMFKGLNHQHQTLEEII